jgi:Rps23 Pro-64 3,4-dihydroxylase Tpa1-like proline 4-hydroxylase
MRRTVFEHSDHFNDLNKLFSDAKQWKSCLAQSYGINTYDQNIRVSEEFTGSIPHHNWLNDEDAMDGHYVDCMQLLRYNVGDHFTKHVDYASQRSANQHVATYLLFPPSNGSLNGSSNNFKGGELIISDGRGSDTINI